MAVGDIYKVASVANFQGSMIVNTFHYTASAQPAPTTAVPDLADAFITVANAIRQCQTGQVTYDRIEVQKIFPGIQSRRYDAPYGFSGSAFGDAAVSSVALVIKRATDYAGRKNRGRIYVAGIPFAAITLGSGEWNQPYPPAWGAAAATMTLTLTAQNGNAYVPIIYNRVTHLFNPITVGSLNGVPRNQRRRQHGRGS